MKDRAELPLDSEIWKKGKEKETDRKRDDLQPTAKKHVNILMHMMGYFNKVLSGDE